MKVYVLNKDKTPLMPTDPPKARIMLKQGKAKVVSKLPFTIRLTYQIENPVLQEIVAGMDTGSKVIGSAAVANNEVLYSAEVQIRNDVTRKMKDRKGYRIARRRRKTRYRQCRFENRANSKREGRIAPAVKSKIDSHHREKKQIESILPISKWIVETASFDIHKISNSEVNGVGYQNGPLKNFYNDKAYAMFRDGYECQSGENIKHSVKLNAHHIIFRSKQGLDTHWNLLTLCETCHENYHKGLFTLKQEGKKSNTKHAAHIGIIKSQLLKSNWVFEETFGYETKYKRENVLSSPKSHLNDAIAICCNDNQVPKMNQHNIYTKRHIAKGNYQRTFGNRSEFRYPKGKLYGYRTWDYINTPSGRGFIKSRRTRGIFILSDINGKQIIKKGSFSIHNNCQRITTRTTTLINIGRQFNV